MAPKKISFRLDGETFSSSPISRGPRRVAVFLEASKDGAMFSTKELALQLGYTLMSFRNFSTAQELESYRARVRFPSIQTVWGSRRTIAALRKNKKVLA